MISVPSSSQRLSGQSPSSLSALQHLLVHLQITDHQVTHHIFNHTHIHVYTLSHCTYTLDSTPPAISFTSHSFTHHAPLPVCSIVSFFLSCRQFLLHVPKLNETSSLKMRFLAILHNAQVKCRLRMSVQASAT